MKRKRSRIPAVLLCLGCLFQCRPAAAAGQAEEGPAPLPRAPETAVRAWRDAGFGIFIHWGAYTALHGRWKNLEKKRDLWGEWILKRARIPLPEYEKAVRSFRPDAFNADAWADLFRSAGARYVVITAKHHDGFAMFPSQVSSWNLRDHCGIERDLLRELADACRKRGLGFGFYYSHRIDWHAPGGAGGPKSSAGFDAYWTNKCLPQVAELTTNYGPLSVMWFDMGCSDTDKVLRLRRLVLTNQPRCVVNSRIGAGLGDYASQKDCFVPSSPRTGPWETHMTLNAHWARYPQDVYYKPPAKVIRTLVRVRSMGGNFLLNVGPDETGRIPLVETATLLRIGEWMKRFGDSVYGVEASPLPPPAWGCCTRKGDRLFLHLFRLPADGTLLVPGLRSRVRRVSLLGDPACAAISAEAPGPFGVVLRFLPEKLTAAALDPADTVVVLSCGEPLRIDPTPLLDPDFDTTFPPDAAETDRPLAVRRFRVRDARSFDPQVDLSTYRSALVHFLPGVRAQWIFHNPRPDTFRVIADYALDRDRAPAGATLLLRCGGVERRIPLPPTGPRASKKEPPPFTRKLLTEIDLPRGRTFRLSVESPDGGDALFLGPITFVPGRLR